MNSLTALFDWLLTASFRASVLVLVVLAIQWAFRRQLAARARYALWLPVLIVLLTPVLPQSRWSIENVFKTDEKPVSMPLIVQTAPTTVSAPIIENITPISTPLDWSKIGLTA
jgi:beta-lactamase regulating signal transducer with metallopeptidase domain